MPTNLLRAKSKPRASTSPPAGGTRRVRIVAGRVAIRAELLDTPTADRIWAALPLFSTAETWGESIHFETPVESGRDRSARTLAVVGDIHFWTEDDRIMVPFGPTPISKSGEIRLPQPCNIWARAIDDVRALKDVRPGEKVSVSAMDGVPDV